MNNIIGKLLKTLKISNLNSDHKRVLENFFSLATLQGLNYILPLITFPYLVRVLGVDNYGLIGYSSAFMSYFQLLVDYGFNLSATKEVSINRNDKKKISEIFSSVLVVKLLIFIISFIVMLIIVMGFEIFRQDSSVYIVTFIAIVGNILFPVWLFQGFEKMKYITALNLLTRVIMTSLIFILIKNEQDLLKFVALNTVTTVFIGILSILIVVKLFEVKFIVPKYENIKNQLTEGWHIFLSTFSTNIYMSSNIFILRIFASKQIVGYYYIAEKIITALRGIAGAVFQAIYPYVCKKVKTSSIIEVKRFFKRVMIPVCLGFFIAGVMLFAFSSQIIHIISGKRLNEYTVTILRMICFVPFIVSLNIPAYQTLLVNEFKKSYSFIVLTGSVLNLALNLILAHNFSAYGTAVSVLITELYITIGFYIVIEIKHRSYSLIGLSEVKHE